METAARDPDFGTERGDSGARRQEQRLPAIE